MKQFSDVTLKVKERKFYISKLYLSSHSPYFATLFLGRFQESEKSEIELKDVNPQDFQYYLEVLHLENGIDDDTLQGILSVADMFDTPKIVEKCEEFLVKESKKGLKEKLEMAGSYRLEELKKQCLNQIKSRADINRAAITRCNRRERWVDESIRRREALTRAVLENAKTDEEKSAAAALELYVDRQQVLLLAQVSDAALGEAREIEDEAQVQQENGDNN
ncbi:hypothetical protein L5515_015557 [Caenorhabditis briggsae]|uniref:BTB domain-containing protein n=1 Tax=Caenorhabditis briggsae TaxID=6238 RepID=A0AAE9EG63_CAEBR|nr:hypothetical protein L5515_015557 [Caenorhabditis briggsae]